METKSVTLATSWVLIAENPKSGAPAQVSIQTPFRVGRREGLELSLECRNVSGLHAEMLESEGQLWLQDLNSTNGTFVNGQRISSRVSLQPSDTVEFGSSVFKLATAASKGRQVFDGTTESSREEDAAAAEEEFELLLNGGIAPFYQPIFDITDNGEQRVGYEVLARSRMPGLRTAGEMFAAAKRLNREAELSRALRFRGVEAAEAAVPAERMLFLNAHPTELALGGLGESMYEVREAFPDRAIVLELPESILKAPDQVVGLRGVLKELGIKLAIHDFGAGKIRLSELAELAPDIVKFDGALIQGINKATTKRQRLIAAMALMVNELDITPMAEFIESAGEHDALNQLGIHYAQGYHYGRPADIAAVSESELAESERKAAAESVKAAAAVASIDQLIKLAGSIDQPIENSRPNKTKHRNVVRDSQWLLGQSSEGYTIQVMTTTSREEADAFIVAQSEVGDYGVYRKPGRSRYLVVFSTFSNRAAAEVQAEAFEALGLSTWVRSLSIVHKEIEMVARLESLYAAKG